MNKRVLEARQKLSDLRKKYCVDNLLKYEKKRILSDESLDISSESETDSKNVTKAVRNAENSDKSVAHSSNEKFNKISSTNKSLDLAENDYISLESTKRLKSSHSFVSKSSSHSEISSIQSSKKTVDANLSEIRSPISLKKSDNVVNALPDLELFHGSDISSVKSYEEKGYSQSEIEEDFSDNSDVEDDTSIVNPLANVHLVSDEILDSIESSIEFIDSIKEKIQDGEISAIHNINSLHLSTPLEQNDYESDFELSEYESDEKFDVEKSKHNFSNINNKSSKQSIFNESKFTPEKLDVQEVTVTSDSLIKQTSSINYAHNSSLGVPKSSSEGSKSEIRTDSRFSSDTKSKNITNSFVKDHEVTESKAITIKSSSGKSESSEFSELETDIKSMNSYKDTLDKKNYNNKNDVGVTVNFSTSFCKNVSVQTSDRPNINIIRQNISEEITPPKQRKQKLYVINTSVKSTKYRPTVKMSRLFNDSSVIPQDLTFNLHNMHTEHDGLTIDSLLRNQIAMTKYFINCHQRLYIQCCKTVKLLNENYKKSKTCIYVGEL